MKRCIPAALVIVATFVGHVVALEEVRARGTHGETLHDGRSDAGSSTDEGASRRQTSSEDTLRARLLDAERGAALTVTLRDGSRAAGRLEDVTHQGFRLRLESGARREYRFGEVLDVWIAPRIQADSPSPTGGWSKKKTLWVAAIVVGVLVGVANAAYYHSP